MKMKRYNVGDNRTRRMAIEEEIEKEMGIGESLFSEPLLLINVTLTKPKPITN